MEMQHRMTARIILMNAGAPDMELRDKRLDELSAILEAAHEIAVALRRVEIRQLVSANADVIASGR